MHTLISLDSGVLRIRRPVADHFNEQRWRRLIAPGLALLRGLGGGTLLLPHHPDDLS